MECSNCYEEYDDIKHIPLNLECGHTFCKQCIKNLLKQSPKLECPICRKRISPFLDVDMLTKNFIVLQTAKTLTKTKSFLNLCSKHHLEPLRFFCNECNLEICAECLINHSGHYIKKQEYSKQIIIDKINELNLKIKKEEKKIAIRMYRNQQKRNELDTQYKKGYNKITQFCEQTQQVMNLSFNEIQQNFDDKILQKIKELKKIKIDTQQYLNEFETYHKILMEIQSYIRDKNYIKDENQVQQLENLEKKIKKNFELNDKKNQMVQQGDIKIYLNDNYKQQLQNSLAIVQDKKEPFLVFFGQKDLVLLYRIKTDKWSLKRIIQDNMIDEYNFKDYSASCLMDDYKIILFGGGKSKDIIEFNLKNFQTKKIGEMQYNRTEHCVQKIGNRVYIMGGFNRQENICLNQCEIFHYDQKINIKMKDMYNKRCGFSSTCYQGNIYVFGGFQGKTRLDEIERYDPQQNTWQLLNLRLPIKLTNGAAICYNDKILIFGGDNEEGFSMRPIKIDLKNNKTSYKYQLKQGKDLRGKLFLLEDEIFMIGSNKDSRYSFNFMNKQWKKLACYDNLLLSSKLDSWTGCIVNLDQSQLPSDYSYNPFKEEVYLSSSSYENLFRNDSYDLQISIEDSINDVFESDNEIYFQIILKLIKNIIQKRTGGRIERL